MGTRGHAALTPEETREVCDLFRWGMEVWMILAFYGISKRTLKGYLRKHGVPARPNGKPRHIDLDVTSSRRRSRELAAAGPDPFEDAYRLVREHARALSDTHTAPHLADESIHSCLEGAS